MRTRLLSCWVVELTRQLPNNPRPNILNLSDLHIIYTLFASSARLQRKRAYLTIAAIAWGTVAILMLLAFGEGLRRQLDKNRRSTGENLAVIWPSETSKPYKGLPSGRAIRPRVADVDFIRERLPELASGTRRDADVAHRGLRPQDENGRVIGANWSYGESRKHYPQAGGRFFNAEDEQQRRRVIFLGDEMAKDIFHDENPVGKTLLVNNSPYTRHRRDAAQDADGDVRRSGCQPRRHSRSPRSARSSGASAQRAGDRDVKDPASMKSELRKLNELLGRSIGYDPTDDRACRRGTWSRAPRRQEDPDRHPALPRHRRRADAAHRRRRRGEHHVRRGEGADARDRREDGPRREAALDHHPVRRSRRCLHADRRRARHHHRHAARRADELHPDRKNKVLSFLGRPTLSPQIGVATSLILGIIGLAGRLLPRAARGVGRSRRDAALRIGDPQWQRTN
jgi:hypothetical protein